MISVELHKRLVDPATSKPTLARLGAGHAARSLTIAFAACSR